KVKHPRPFGCSEMFLVFGVWDLGSSSSLPSAIVPGMPGLTTGQGLSPRDHSSSQKPEMLTQGVQVNFPRRGQKGITVKNHDLLSTFSSQPLQALAQVQLLAREQFLAEPAYLAKSAGLAKNERPSHPIKCAADPVPAVRHEIGLRIIPLQLDRYSSGQAFPGLDLFHDLDKKFCAGLRVCINKNQPISGSRPCAAVAGPRDLIDRLEHHGRSRGARNFGGTVGRIVVANDDLGPPATLMKNRQCRLHLTQCRSDEPFLIKGGD